MRARLLLSPQLRPPAASCSGFYAGSCRPAAFSRLFTASRLQSLRCLQWVRVYKACVELTVTFTLEIYIKNTRFLWLLVGCVDTFCLWLGAYICCDWQLCDNFFIWVNYCWEIVEEFRNSVIHVVSVFVVRQNTIFQWILFVYLNSLEGIIDYRIVIGK